MLFVEQYPLLVTFLATLADRLPEQVIIDIESNMLRLRIQLSGILIVTAFSVSLLNAPVNRLSRLLNA